MLLMQRVVVIPIENTFYSSLSLQLWYLKLQVQKVLSLSSVLDTDKQKIAVLSLKQLSGFIQSCNLGCALSSNLICSWVKPS